MVDVPRAPSPGIGVCGPVPGGQPQTFYTDLTAIITGPNHGRFPQTFPPVAASPDRNQPFREFTIHYHEVPDATQAFTDFYPPVQVTTTLTTGITATSTSPLKVASTTAFPANGFVTVNSGNGTETIQYEGKSATQLGTTKIVRGLNTPAGCTPGSTCQGSAAAASKPITLYQTSDISGM